MRICYLADAADVHTHRWAKYFANEGHEVHLISFRPSSENLGNIQLHLLNTIGKGNPIFKHTINPFAVLIQLRKLIKEIDPEVLHGHSVRDHTIIAALTGFHPFVVTAWGDDVLIHPKESKILKYAVPFALRRADLVTCDGANTKSAMMEMGIKGDDIEIIMHGVDTKKFDILQGDEELRRELDVSNSPTIISTRRLGRVHDVGTLINAIPLVLKEVPDAKFVIGGSGEQKEHLMDLAKSLGVFDSTRFVGWIQSDQLPRYLNSSDIYVSTSLSDSGLAAGTAEAMACGLPVVITDFGDNGKWVEDGVSGFTFPLRDSKSLAEKIVYLIQNPNIRRDFGAGSRVVIEERNNYYREMKKMEKLYKDLILRSEL